MSVAVQGEVEGGTGGWFIHLLIYYWVARTSQYMNFKFPPFKKSDLFVKLVTSPGSREAKLFTITSCSRPYLYSKSGKANICHSGVGLYDTMRRDCLFKSGKLNIYTYKLYILCECLFIMLFNCCDFYTASIQALSWLDFVRLNKKKTQLYDCVLSY